MTNMTKIYPVVFTLTDSGFVASVPDLNIDTQGKDLAEAIYMARDAIGLWGIAQQDAGRDIPEPSTTEPAHEKEEIVSWVDIDFDAYRRMNDMTLVRMNITIPKRLKYLGDKEKLNFSGFFQDALNAHFNIQ